MFLVGAFSFKEKIPTITVASFFFLFFRQTTELIAYVPLFTETDKTTQAKSGQWKQCKGSPLSFFYLFYVTYKTGRDQRVPLSIFFRHCAKFFSKFFYGLKRVPPSSFLIFCNRMYVNEAQRVPLFHFSALCDIFEVFFKKKIFKKIFKFCFVPRETVIFQSYRA